jgi:hypothetical protein
MLLLPEWPFKLGPQILKISLEHEAELGPVEQNGPGRGDSRRRLTLGVGRSERRPKLRLQHTSLARGSDTREARRAVQTDTFARDSS